jgi:hypothetical protein
MAKIRRYRGTVRVTLEPPEQAMLAGLVAQVTAMLAPSDPTPRDELEGLVGLSSEPVATPQDPALLRLLPDAYRDDDERAAEFRRYTDSDLRATKLANLRSIVNALSSVTEARRVELDEQAAVAWLHGLNDIRLAMGTRLDIGEDIDAERAPLSPGDPRYDEVAVYDWLSWLQESLVAAVSRD